eukprot:GSMAST32.ASY1.ANO1.1145.1 assembled CDS
MAAKALDVAVSKKAEECLRNQVIAVNETKMLMQKQVTDAVSLYTDESMRRRKIHNKLIELQGLFCRVRPIVDSEKNRDDATFTKNCIYFPSPHDISVHLNIDKTKTNKTNIIQDVRRFEFDRVFSGESSQKQVFEDVSPLITSVMDGYKILKYFSKIHNVCIFAYGQTGSGKTYTMQGPPDDPGVNYRSMYVSTNREADIKYTIKMSMFEIYNEQIHDLLKIRSKANGKNFHSLMRSGELNRSVGSHSMNERTFSFQFFIFFFFFFFL